MNYTEAEIFLTALLQSELPDAISYHDFSHTKSVINAAEEIAHAENISDKNEINLLKTAALFHDCGFVNTYIGHEEEGCAMAKKLLPGFGYSEEQIETVCSLIMVTKVPQQPKTILEKILCDADLFYLGSDSYSMIAQKLYDEWNAHGKVISEKEWHQMQIHFLESHHYWTRSASEKRDAKKTDNLRKLREKILK